MENNQNGYNDEISLKELILAIWSEKKLISIVAGLIILLTIIYAFGFVNKTYKSESDMMMKVPVETDTRYGIYTYPTDNVATYIQFIYSDEVIRDIYEIYGGDKTPYNFTESGIKNLIYVEFNQTKDNLNNFKVSIEVSDPELARNMLNDTIKSFEKNLRIYYKNIAVNYFIDYFRVDIAKNENIIKVQEQTLVVDEELLSTLDKTFDVKKALFDDQDLTAVEGYSGNLNSLIDSTVVEQLPDVDYQTIKTKIVASKSLINDTKVLLENNKVFYDELNGEKELISTNLNTENEQLILNGKLDVLNGYVSVIVPPTLPSTPEGAGKGVILLIGVVLAGMIGIFAGIFANYWKNK